MQAIPEGLIWKLAEWTAESSTCVRAKVGAVAIDGEGAIVGVGYNKVHGSRSCAQHCPRGQLTFEQRPPGGDYSDCLSVHAEVEALRAGPTARFIYTTRKPCEGCMGTLLDAGVRPVWR